MYKSIKFFIIFIFLIILGVLSLPLFVDEQKIVGLIEEKIQPGDVSVLGVVGAGLTWGSAVIKW